MTASCQDVIGYLADVASDPFPRYLLHKDVLGLTPTGADCEAIAASTWHAQLAGEQWDNGSWGRFHTQDTRAPRKQRFVTTECALARARDLSLPAGDPVVRKAIGLMERYLCDREVWLDTNEKHYGFEIAFKTLIAANLSIFDPDNPLLRGKREVCAGNLATACAGGSLDEGVWERENRKSHEILLEISTVYPAWLLQHNAFLREDVQRQYLAWLWHRPGGIYYVGNMPPADMRPLEDKAFTRWLSTLENLADFSLFPEFMNTGASEHLLQEIRRLMTGGVALPPAAPIVGHYAETWRAKSARRHDLMLRMLRVLVKAQ